MVSSEGEAHLREDAGGELEVGLEADLVVEDEGAVQPLAPGLVADGRGAGRG